MSFARSVAAMGLTPVSPPIVWLVAWDPTTIASLIHDGKRRII